MNRISKRWWTRADGIHAIMRPGYIRVINNQRGILQEVDGFQSVYQAEASLELNGFRPIGIPPGRGKYHDLESPVPIPWKSLWLPDAGASASLAVH